MGALILLAVSLAVVLALRWLLAASKRRSIDTTSSSAALRDARRALAAGDLAEMIDVIDRGFAGANQLALRARRPRETWRSSLGCSTAASRSIGLALLRSLGPEIVARGQREGEERYAAVGE